MKASPQKPSTIDGVSWLYHFLVRSVFVMLLLAAVIVFALYGMVFPHK
jgi:hypothetical protein